MNKDNKMIINEQELKAIIVEELQKDEGFQQLLNEFLRGMGTKFIDDVVRYSKEPLKAAGESIARRFAPRSISGARAAAKHVARTQNEKFFAKLNKDPDFYDWVRRVKADDPGMRNRWARFEHESRSGNIHNAQYHLTKFQDEIYKLRHPHVPASVPTGTPPPPRPPGGAPPGSRSTSGGGTDGGGGGGGGGDVDPSGAGRAIKTALGLGGVAGGTAYAYNECSQPLLDASGNPIYNKKTGGPICQDYVQPAFDWVFDTFGLPPEDWTPESVDSDMVSDEEMERKIVNAKKAQRQRVLNMKHNRGTENIDAMGIDEAVSHIVDDFLQQILLEVVPPSLDLPEPPPIKTPPPTDLTTFGKDEPEELPITPAEKEEMAAEDIEEMKTEGAVKPGGVAAEAAEELEKAGKKAEKETEEKEQQPIGEDLKSYQDRIFEEKFNKLKQAFAKQ